MRKILMFLVLIISINSLGQNIPGYQTRQVREKLIAMSVDSGLHIPRYNGTPSGVRTGVYVADGAIAMDTTNHRLYIYSGGAWLRLANISDSSVANNPSFATNLRLQKIIDSLNAAGGFGTPTLQQVADAGSIRSWSSSGVGITISGTGADDGSAALQIGQGVNGIPIYLTNQNFSPLHQGGEWRAMHFERDVVGGSTADGLAIKQTFLLETSSASDTATKVVTGWKVSNHTNRTAFYDVRLVDSGTLKTALQIQPDYLIVNNLTDTLATLQDVRDGGGGGGGIDSVVLRNDTLFYYVGATPTTITPVIPYDFTSLADGDLLKYDAGGSAFINTKTIEGIRWIPRQDSTTSSATPTINTDNVDIYKLTAQAADITSFTTNLSGTPRHGEILEIQITGTAARAITWGSAFVSSTVTLPTTTSSTATLTVILQYYTNSSYGNFKWVCVNYY